MNRAQQPRANVPNNAHNVASAPMNVAPSNRKTTPASKDSKWVRYATVALLFSVTILVVSVVAYIGFKGQSNEFKYVNKNEYQAVFVNVTGTSGGQVYFGHIQSITDKYVNLTNVFYIQGQSSSSTGTQSSQSSYTLVKLGCELHAPEDQMILNHDQVFFWENLKNSGQVATKIADYYKANPNGTTCNSSSTSSSSSSSSSSTSQTGSSTQNNTSGKSTGSTSTSGQ